MQQEYEIYYQFNGKEVYIGIVRHYENGFGDYTTVWGAEQCREAINDERFFNSAYGVELDFINELMADEFRAKSRRRECYFCGNFIVWRVAKHTGERFLVYSRSAGKGEPGYSDKSHSVPHNEPGAKDMEEWVNLYRFNKFDDGTYEAELDEAWYCGGSHTEGGTVYKEIPDYWQDLPYDEFLEKVVGLAGAKHYRFTADDLRALDGLQEFFGYGDEEGVDKSEPAQE